MAKTTLILTIAAKKTPSAAVRQLIGEEIKKMATRQQAREHITTAGTMFGEMDMRFWLEQGEAEMAALR
jgi:ABC-type molybdenum transport system ATPase subunit/photorepair protein PhrA